MVPEARSARFAQSAPPAFDPASVTSPFRNFRDRVMSDTYEDIRRESNNNIAELERISIVHAINRDIDIHVCCALCARNDVKLLNAFSSEAAEEVHSTFPWLAEKSASVGLHKDRFAPSYLPLSSSSEDLKALSALATMQRCHAQPCLHCTAYHFFEATALPGHSWGSPNARRSDVMRLDGHQ